MLNLCEYGSGLNIHFQIFLSIFISFHYKYVRQPAVYHYTIVNSAICKVTAILVCQFTTQPVLHTFSKFVNVNFHHISENSYPASNFFILRIFILRLLWAIVMLISQSLTYIRLYLWSNSIWRLVSPTAFKNTSKSWFLISSFISVAHTLSSLDYNSGTLHGS